MNTLEFIKAERENLKSKAFSRDTFDKLLVTYLNDPEFQSHNMTKKPADNVAIKTPDYPVKKFRKILYRILIDFGVDAKDAETVKTTYKFKNKTVDGMYDFLTDFIYQYLKTGRRLNLVNKEDMVASIIAEDVEAVKGKKRRMVKDGQSVEIDPVNIAEHKVVKVKSSAPEWTKEVVDKNGKVLKAMKKVCKDL